MIKVCVDKTSDRGYGTRIVRVFESLDECIKTLYSETGCDDYVVSVPDGPDNVDYYVEIYDTYRE